MVSRSNIVGSLFKNSIIDSFSLVTYFYLNSNNHVWRGRSLHVSFHSFNVLMKITCLTTGPSRVVIRLYSLMCFQWYMYHWRGSSEEFFTRNPIFWVWRLFWCTLTQYWLNNYSFIQNVASVLIQHKNFSNINIKLLSNYSIFSKCFPLIQRASNDVDTIEEDVMVVQFSCNKVTEVISKLLRICFTLIIVLNFIRVFFFKTKNQFFFFGGGGVSGDYWVHPHPVLTQNMNCSNFNYYHLAMTEFFKNLITYDGLWVNALPMVHVSLNGE